jgi:hypothetical protein
VSVHRLTIDHVWECPRCGSQVGIGQPGFFTSPPRCCGGIEMEQKSLEAFGKRPEDES